MLLRVRLSAPPSKPCVRLSPHTAFPPSITRITPSHPVVSAFHRRSRVRFSRDGSRRASGTFTRDGVAFQRRQPLCGCLISPKGSTITFASIVSTDCRPSPCGRFFRPRTTMAAPTLDAIIGRCWPCHFAPSLSRSQDRTLRDDLGGGYGGLMPLFAES